MLTNKKITDSFIVDAISSIVDIAHIKDAKTKQYIHCNTATLQHFGLTKPEEITGLTTSDLDGFMRPHWGEEYANQIDAMDHTVYTQLEVVSRTEVTIAKSGFIHVHTLNKIPVIDHNGKASSIFTFSQNLMDTIEFVPLYELYKKHYPDQQEGVKYFLKYMSTAERAPKIYMSEDYLDRLKKERGIKDH